MHTYWLLGPTQVYLSLTKATCNRTIPISGLPAENKKEPLTVPSNAVTSTILNGLEATFDDDGLIDPTSSLTRTSPTAKSYALNKNKEQQLTCPFSGANLF